MNLLDFFSLYTNLKMMCEGMPVYDPQELALKYIRLAQSGAQPTESQVEMIRDGVEAFCRKVHGDNQEAIQADLAGVEATWSEMKDRFMGSIGLTQMMLDYGVNSRYFYEYLRQTGRGHFAVALEAKDGRALPVSGKMSFELVPRDDWMNIVNVEEPSHPARRQTDYCCQSLLRNSDMIFECGAGLLPAYRNYEYAGKKGQRIVAVDNDPEMLRYLPLVFEQEALNSHGIEYHIADVADYMMKTELEHKFDVVRMTGFLSYFPKIETKIDLMRKATGLLRENGVIAVDLWTMGSSLVRTAVINLWSIDMTAPVHLAPAADVSTAIRDMTEICEALGLPFVYKVDVCNGNPKCRTQAAAVPKCVMFLVGKSVSEDMFDSIPRLE